MSCFFCSSNNHVTHYCDIYVSDQERFDILCTKNCCQMCLAAHKPNFYCSWCEVCQNLPIANKKCYICFSKLHHTVYCPDRLKALKMFPPNIDNVILPRFISTLTLQEKYLLVFSFPDILNFVKLKPINVLFKEKEEYFDMEIISKADIFIVEKMICSLWYKDLIKSGILKTLVLRIKCLKITVSKFSTVELLQLLLSPNMKSLECYKVKFSRKLLFRKILENAPNLEEIIIPQTNIKCDISWTDDLLELSRAKNLKNICLSIAEQDIDVKKLAALIKEKETNIHLYIIITQEQPLDQKKTFEMITNKLSTHFSPTPSKAQSILTISFNLGKGKEKEKSDSRKFKLKHNPPSITCPNKKRRL